MKRIILSFSFLCISLLANAQATDLVIDCQTPGSLSSKINTSDQPTVRNLKVTGYINDTDLDFIGRLTQYSLNGIIDLYDVTIIGNSWNGSFKHLEKVYSEDYHYHIQKLILPQTLKNYCEPESSSYGLSKSSVDTLIFDTKIKTIKGYDPSHRNNRTDTRPTFTRKINHLILGENLDSIISIRTANSVHLPNSLKFIDNYAFRGRTDFSDWNIKEFPNLEHLGYCAFTYGSPGSGVPRPNETLPDSIFFPKIKSFCMSSLDYKSGMHIFFGESLKNIFDDDGVGWSNKFYPKIDNVSFHFKSMTPPTTGTAHCSSSCIIYVPKGAKQNYSENSDFKRFEIIEEKEPLKGILINRHEAMLEVNEVIYLTASPIPENADDAIILWKCDNELIANVNGSGMVTALSPGEAIVYASSTDGKIRDVCKITVKAHAESVSIVPESIVLNHISVTTQLISNILPENSTDKSVTWNSSNEQVCTVSSTGLVTAVGPGTAIVTVTTVDGGHTASCTVKVLQHVTSVTLEKHTSTLNVGEQELIRASILPENADDKTVKWTSSDNTIASVDANGNVTALKTGETWIKVISNDNSLEKDSCKLTVIQPVTGISLSKENMTLNNIGDNDQLTATIMPADASNKEVRWSSSNDNVCIVNNGLVTAVGAGTSSVTATTVDGSFTATCIVNVTQHVSDIELNKSALSLKVGESEKLQATVLPQNAENKMVTWTSSDSRIAIVDANGNVAAIKAGEAWIKAVSTDNPLAKDSCKLTVIQPVTNIKITPETYRFTNIGENIQLETTVLPEDATNKDVKWSSTNESVCVVANGKVIATGYGTAVVLATTIDGGHTVSCAIVVEKETIPVTGINLSQNTANLYKGETLLLTAEITPQNATNKNLIWKSSNESICIVSQSGLLVGLNEGNAIITVTPENGVGQAQCVVTVEDNANAIQSINEDTNNDVPVYDLMGQKVTHLVKGRIYICKGKKFVAR